MKINVSDLPVEKNNHSYMIKDSKGTILSKADYFNYKLKDFDWVLMANVETKPNYRGKGLATRIINKLCDDIFKTTNKGVYLLVKTDNYNAIRLYRKLNFKIVKKYSIDNEPYFIIAKGNADIDQLKKREFS